MTIIITIVVTLAVVFCIQEYFLDNSNNLFGWDIRRVGAWSRKYWYRVIQIDVYTTNKSLRIGKLIINKRTVSNE
jgi:hypothetical protein